MLLLSVKKEWNHMKIATICNMDDKGRIVIPSAIRKMMQMADSEALEVESAGQDIRLRKCQPSAPDSEQIQTYLDILYSVVPCGAFVCSPKTVYASKGIHLPKGSAVPKELADYVASGEQIVFNPEYPIFIRPQYKIPVTALFPITGDSPAHPVLALVLLAKHSQPLSDMELGSAKLVAATLAHQLN